jgi:hypothetical protein
MCESDRVCCRGCGKQLRQMQIDHQLGNPSYARWCREGYCSLDCFREYAPADDERAPHARSADPSGPSVSVRAPEAVHAASLPSSPASLSANTGQRAMSTTERAIRCVGGVLAVLFFPALVIVRLVTGIGPSLIHWGVAAVFLGWGIKDLRAVLQSPPAPSSPVVQDELRQLEKPDVARIDYYVECLQHEHPRVREAAAEMLGELGARAIRARPRLLEAKRDPDGHVRTRVGWALNRVRSK